MSSGRPWGEQDGPPTTPPSGESTVPTPDLAITPPAGVPVAAPPVPPTAPPLAWPPISPGPPAMPPWPPTAVAPTPGPTRRNRWNILLVVMIVLLLAGAGVLVAASRLAASDTSAANAQAASFEQHRAALVARADHADQHRHDLTAAAGAVGTAFDQLDNALSAVTDAQNHLVDIEDQAVTLHDAGNTAGASQLLTTQGDPALADLARRSVAVDQAIAQAQAAAQRLQKALHG